ncbi:MAG TPA: hypothetical protein VF741_00885 [Candidatus Aquilonibacter sp.]
MILALVFAIGTQAAANMFALAHQLCTADDGRTWGISLCGPMMFVDPKTHQAIANEPVEGATLDHGLYRFTLGKDVGNANTSLEFQGKRWIMILWPLFGDDQTHHVILMHESYHRIQPELHLEGGGGLGTNGYLDDENGRIWLRAEIHALTAALQASGDARTRALHDAVAFARYRWSLFPDAQEQERSLDLNEGLAESTGIDVGLAPDDRIPYALKDLQLAEQTPSYVRSFPYGIGPGYVELMDARDPQWRKDVTNDTNITLLAASLYGLNVATPSEQQAKTLLASYDGTAILQQEDARAARMAQQRQRYEKEFVGGPVLVLPMKKFSITFNPQDVEQFGDHGSVYHTLQITDAWGTLHVDGGDALVSKNFDQVEVPYTGSAASGTGWKLELTPSYRVTPVTNSPNSLTVTKGP